jgi:single-stranded-DNA-specific exonuclease
MAQRRNPGIAALSDVGRIDRRLDVFHAGFVLGPRVNAGGRVGESGLGVRLLATDDPVEALALAHTLDCYNRERQEIELRVLDAALEQAARQAADGARLILVAGEGWHPGVIGIVAGRLRERFDRPACVVALDGGIGKGSGRSVPGVALGPAVISARQAGLLLNGGGHAMAAGFAVAADRVAALHDFLVAEIDRQLGGQSIIPSLGLDGALEVAAATPALLESIERLGPFGAGNARPRFALAQARLVDVQPAGMHHLRCVLTGPDGTGRLKAIAFRAAGTALGEALIATRGMPLHLAGQLRLDEWQGTTSAQLMIDDAATVMG